MINFQHILVLDNRIYSPSSFEEDAGYASYHRLSSALIFKFLALCQRNETWISSVFLLAIAGSPEKVNIIKNSTDQSMLLKTDMLQPRYSCTGEGNCIPHNTWGAYFLDAVRKLNNEISKIVRHNPAVKLVVTFISTDLSLLGPPQAASISESLSTLSTAIKNLRERFSNVKLRFVCSVVSERSTGQLFSHLNYPSIGSFLRNFEGAVTFHPIICSPTHFDAELHLLIAMSAPSMQLSLNFPSTSGSQCTLVVHIRASTFDSATALANMNRNVKSVQICGIVHRTTIDATFIDGKGMRVIPPISGDADSLLKSELSRRQNALTFRAVDKWLGDKDAALLLRVADEDVRSFWLLVPSGKESEKDGLYMAMVRLVDRDDILVQDEIDSTDLTSMICPTETDAAILEDLAFYLEQSVESVLGNVIKYNPMGYASGKNDILYRRIFEDRHSTAHDKVTRLVDTTAHVKNVPSTLKLASGGANSRGNLGEKASSSRTVTKGSASIGVSKAKGDIVEYREEDNEGGDSPVYHFESFSTKQSKARSSQKTKAKTVARRTSRENVGPASQKTVKHGEPDNVTVHATQQESEKHVSAQSTAASDSRKTSCRLLKRKFVGGIKTVGEWTTEEM